MADENLINPFSYHDKNITQVLNVGKKQNIHAAKCRHISNNHSEDLKFHSSFNIPTDSHDISFSPEESTSPIYSNKIESVSSNDKRVDTDQSHMHKIDKTTKFVKGSQKVIITSSPNNYHHKETLSTESQRSTNKSFKQSTVDEKEKLSKMKKENSELIHRIARYESQAEYTKRLLLFYQEEIKNMKSYFNQCKLKEITEGESMLMLEIKHLNQVINFKSRENELLTRENKSIALQLKKMHMYIKDHIRIQNRENVICKNETINFIEKDGKVNRYSGYVWVDNPIHFSIIPKKEKCKETLNEEIQSQMSQMKSLSSKRRQVFSKDLTKEEKENGVLKEQESNVHDNIIRGIKSNIFALHDFELLSKIVDI